MVIEIHYQKVIVLHEDVKNRHRISEYDLYFGCLSSK